MKMKAAVVHEAGQPYQIETVDLAEPKEDEVLVKNVSAGVCMTDESCRSGYIGVRPIVLGHEGAGIIEKVGANVKDLKPGDHVVLCKAYCGECRCCKMEGYGHCMRIPDITSNGKMMDGTTRITQNGKTIYSFYGMAGFAEYSVCHKHAVTKVDKEVDLKALSPIGCGIMTGAGTVLKYLKPKAHESIVITGCGSVGTSALMAAKIAGCKNIFAVDIAPEKLDRAKGFGATHTINSKETPNFEEQILEITGYGAEYFIDTCGVQSVIDSGFKALARLGTVVPLAVKKEITVPLLTMVIGGITVAGVAASHAWSKQDFIPELIQYYKEGKFPFDKLNTYYAFEDINKALEDVKGGHTIKAVVTF